MIQSSFCATLDPKLGPKKEIEPSSGTVAASANDEAKDRKEEIFRRNKATICLRMSSLTQKERKNKANLDRPCDKSLAQPRTKRR